MNLNPELIIRDGYLSDRETVVDISIADGKILSIADSLEDNADREINASGRLVSSGLVDAHFHTDMALAATGERLPKYEYETTDRNILIQKSKEYFVEQSPDEIRSQIRKAVKLAVRNGVLHLRNHVYLDSTVGTKVIEATLDVQKELEDLVDMEVIAFPQQGFLRDQGSQQVAHKAINMGADLVGGIDPGTINNDIQKTIDTWFDIATNHDVDIDAHLHDRGALGMYTLERIADRTIKEGYEGRVTASHCYALADAADENGKYHGPSLDTVLNKLATANIDIVTCYQSTRPGMPVSQFDKRNLIMAHGTDGARQVWGPFGNVNSLEAMLVNSIKLNLDSSQNFKTNKGLQQLWNLITTNGAEVMNIKETYPIKPGKPADIVVHDAKSPQWAIIKAPKPHYVIKDGQIVSQNESNKV